MKTPLGQWLSGVFVYLAPEALRKAARTHPMRKAPPDRGQAGLRCLGLRKPNQAVGGLPGRITVTRRPPIGERLASIRP